MAMSNNKALLIILDGWGLGQNPAADAIAQANTPNFDALMARYPHATLVTHGEEVGLPDGQMGNSEVGHLNIGAGRVVYQELARINRAVRDGSLAANATLLAALDYAKANNKPVHLIGLVSDGGVHSHIEHVKALCDIAVGHGVAHTYVHAFTDGRDTDPKSGVGFLADLVNHLEGKPAKLASIVGRYYAMDRDNRWERVKLAYDLLVHGQGELAQDPLGLLASRYEQGQTDEFILPIACADAQGAPLATLRDGDVVLCFNFRTDRPREITMALTQRAFPEQQMSPLHLRYLTMTRYDDTFTGVDILFEKKDLNNTLGEVVAAAGKTQVRIAETEKYPHVTFFFSGGREEPFAQERRLLIPSPKDVPTYDLKPEMSAYGITDAIVADIAANGPDFICLNYANTDMVGHTGDFKAAMRAAEVVDECLGRLLDTALAHGYEAIVIADHGNSDYMINPDGSPNTAHTLNPVPCIFVSGRADGYRVTNGKLGDIAPTLLWIMGITPPVDMEGRCLVENK
jgi:2,3-bisphosphoglycerate-independent phosphoglycerate mutase